jgi:hypothetical protein
VLHRASIGKNKSDRFLPIAFDKMGFGALLFHQQGFPTKNPDRWRDREIQDRRYSMSGWVERQGFATACLRTAFLNRQVFLILSVRS